jgi:small acid-soluble spore protein H (minor)
MYKQRAMEIAASPEMANVTYGDKPIYIQHVDEDKEVARIYDLEHPEHELEVPLAMLFEHGDQETRMDAPNVCLNN